MTATSAVQSAALSGTAAVHDLSMWGLFLQADFIVKFVILMLIFMSFWCWAIIFEKWMLMKAARMKAKTFENDFWSSDALDKFFDRIKKKNASHPMAIVFSAGMEEWQRSKGANIPTKNLRERIGKVMEVTRNREIERLENGLGFLAITSSSAPFIGLFGTVWGIMNSFHAIALSKNTSLVAVAPGIAEALFATAIGLLAAIPAYMAYNKFSREIGGFAGKLEDFSMEFDNILSRQLDG